MIHSSSSRIFLCTAPTNMNRSVDLLARQAREIFAQDLFHGDLFLFLNHDRDRIKILCWDDNGFCIWFKRLESGTFQLPHTAASEKGIELNVVQFNRLLSGLDLESGRRRRGHRRLR